MTARKNIAQPAEYWAAFSDQAAAENLGLSAWIAEKCLEAIPVDVRESLPDRPKRGPKPKHESATP